MATPLDEATELLQQLIRNQCVNDGRPESGNEVRNAQTLGSYLEHDAHRLVHLARFEDRSGGYDLILHRP